MIMDVSFSALLVIMILYPKKKTFFLCGILFFKKNDVILSNSLIFYRSRIKPRTKNDTNLKKL